MKKTTEPLWGFSERLAQAAALAAAKAANAPTRAIANQLSYSDAIHLNVIDHVYSCALPMFHPPHLTHAVLFPSAVSVCPCAPRRVCLMVFIRIMYKVCYLPAGACNEGRLLDRTV